MIRRIKRGSDLRDLIKSCPSGVIDDIYKIEYYIQGYGDTVEAQFTKKGTMLEVILPTSLLEELPNGVLMRRAYYKTTDSSFPDGEYNLEFEDNMGVWLGDDEAGEVPESGTTWGSITGSLTSQTDLVNYIEVMNEAYFNATKTWVSGQGYASVSKVDELQSLVITKYIPDALEGYATESWVQNQGYITSSALSGYATETYVQNQGYITSSALSGYATESYVDQAIEDAIFGSDIPLPENIVEYDVNHPLIEEFDLNVDVLKRPEFDHGTDVMTKGLVLGYTETKDNNVVTDIDTIEIRDSLLMAVSYSYDGEDYHESRDPYVTQSWIGNQGYITTASLSGYATEQWVGQQGYITSAALSGYATETWVGNQGYITSSALSGYATESWATNQFLEESKVWTGTQAQWNNLTAAQKASYTIALITQ